MDFFHNQDVARRKTVLLVAYFVAAVALMILALYLAALTALSFQSKKAQLDGIDWFRLDVFIAVTLGTLAVISLGSLYKILQLRGGGESVATMLGGRRVHAYTSDPKERRLLNVVEEMAIASGVPVPPVFVLDKEDGINAFAAGYTPGDAVIGVSRGTIDFLSRNELQGVVAHEFSHIMNGDMRLNLRLIGLLNGILLLAILGYYAMRFGGVTPRSRGSGKGGGGYVILIGLAMIVVGYVGLFFARLIKAAVSRQREFLADASAVQFTRDPDGISGALKKIGGLLEGSTMKTPEAETASHMFFGSAFRGLWFGGFATHPPLKERIRRIDPQFDGRFPQTRSAVEQPATKLADKKTAAPSPTEALDRVFGTSGHTMGDKFALSPALVMAAIGAPNTNHVTYAQKLLRSLPGALRSAVHDVFSARAVVLAMLLDDEQDVRERQLEMVEQRLGAVAGKETAKLAPLVAAQGEPARLPLIEIVLSTLHELSPDQYDQFRSTIGELIKADRKVDLFEFALQRILVARLDRHFRKAGPPRVRYPAISGVLGEIATVLSALSFVGHSSEQEAQAAYKQAVSALRVERPPAMLSRDACSLRAIHESLDKLNQSSPGVKQRLLGAAVVVVAIDGQVTVGEAELLRAIGDFLDCPLPPIFAGSFEVPKA